MGSPMSNYRKIIVNSLLSESNKFDVGDFVVYIGDNKDLDNKIGKVLDIYHDIDNNISYGLQLSKNNKDYSEISENDLKDIELFKVANSWSGEDSEDLLTSEQWKEVLEIAPDIYITALKSRLEFLNKTLPEDFFNFFKVYALEKYNKSFDPVEVIATALNNQISYEI